MTRIWFATDDVHEDAVRILKDGGFAICDRDEIPFSGIAWIGLDWPRNLHCHRIAVPATGADHVPEGREITKLEGSELGNVMAVAEWTLQLILRCLRPDGERGRELAGKHVLLWGYGRVGQQVGDMLLDMRAKPHAIDTKHTQSAQDMLSDYLEISDIITMHASYTPGQKPLLDESALVHATSHRCKWVVNTARPGLVDNDALLWCLKKGRLERAAVDFMIPQEHPNLLKYDHMGGQTHESRRKTDVLLAKKLVEKYGRQQTVCGFPMVVNPELKNDAAEQISFVSWDEWEKQKWRVTECEE